MKKVLRYKDGRKVVHEIRKIEEEEIEEEKLVEVR